MTTTTTTTDTTDTTAPERINTMSTTDTDTAALLRGEVAANVATMAAIMAANDRDPNQWTCAGDCEESQWCDDGDDRCNAGECAHVGECTGPDDCEAASDLQSTYGGDGPDDAMRELPLEVVYERGRPFTVVLTVGGPHVEVTGDVYHPASFRIVGYWAGVDPVTMYDDTVTAYAEWWVELLDELGDHA